MKEHHIDRIEEEIENLTDVVGKLHSDVTYLRIEIDCTQAKKD